MRSSAIIGAYNVQPFISEAIQSIANQVDEVIVVEDYSSDATKEVVLRTAALLPNVRVICNESNLGVSSSYNRAVSAASGEYLFICGGDDVSEPNRVQSQILALESSPNILASCSAPNVIREDGLIASEISAAEFIFPNLRLSTVHKLLFGGNFILAPSVAMRKSTFQDMGYFHPELDQLQDFDLWLKLAKAGDIHFSKERLVRYRKRAGSLSGPAIDSRQRDLREALERQFVLKSFLGSCSELELVSLASELIGLRPFFFRPTINLLRSSLYSILKLSDVESEFEIALRKISDGVSLEEQGLSRNSLRGLIQEIKN